MLSRSVPTKPATISACLSLLFLMGCSGTTEHALVGTPQVDSVYGVLQVEPVEGGEMLVTAVLDQLPPAGALGEEKTHFVAWITPIEGVPERLGVVERDAEARQGRVTGTTRHRAFTFFVTAESGPEPEAPANLRVAEKTVTDEND